MNSIPDNWNDNLQSFNREKKNEALVPVFNADWTSVPVPRTSNLRGLDVGFIPPLPKELPYMANNDEYNDEYLCRDFFVGFNVIIRDIRISSSLVTSQQTTPSEVHARDFSWPPVVATFLSNFQS